MTQLLTGDREKIALRRLDGDVKRTAKTRTQATLWLDATKTGANAVFDRIARGHLRYTGVMMGAHQIDELGSQLAPRLTQVVQVEALDLFEEVAGRLREGAVVASANEAVLMAARAKGLKTCLRYYVDDGESLKTSIERGFAYDIVMIRFRDPTNIPLELVIASLQATRTELIKEIQDPQDVDDAVVSLGVMEVGADGVMFSPGDQDTLDAFGKRLAARDTESVAVQVGTVLRSEPVGMGYRSCLDLATIFEPDEGMVVGSTSQGGVLCCPEVFFLPYMELRPFRVNAGAVHSYVYNFDDKTDYMTELRAGAPVMVVGTDGRVRRAAVGRVKTEVRPLRLIEVQFDGGERVNVLMQDDWHVRVFSHESKPLNITELKPGDKVLGYVASPGRHVGIKVDERIVEE